MRICSLLINSGTLIDALTDLLDAGRVEVSGIYDRMADVYRQWQEVMRAPNWPGKTRHLHAHRPA
ncbi:MAG: hypothetical protein M3505_03635 [Verrucomicrobiota bacterium]|nr:hypothetical protein [Chthoniobacterales bacterium]MDQ3313714.1 hypothetical protein [Verrucomicrobiota bacterium]